MSLSPDSISTQCGVSIDTATEILGLIRGTIDPRTYVSVQRWIAQCYNEPDSNALVMCAIDQLLDAHGVEAIHGRDVDRYHGDIVAEYVNQGDTYDSTIIHDNIAGRYRLMSWGDFVDRFAAEYEIA